MWVGGSEKCQNYADVIYGGSRISNLFQEYPEFVFLYGQWLWAWYMGTKISGTITMTIFGSSLDQWQQF